MAYQSNFFGTPQLPESNKFVEITNDSRFPPVSVIKWDYRDSGYSLSSVDIFPKYAVVTYLANPEDIKVSLSAENINVNLADVENILNVISPDVTTIKNNTDAVETTLTTISNNIGTTNTNVGTINTNVADIEALATTTNQNVTAIHTHVDTIRTSVNTINQNVSAVEVLLTTSNTNVGTINTNVADIETLLTRTNTLVNTLTANINTYPVQGTSVSNSNFTSVTPSTELVAAVAGREVLTVFNEGPGNLHISPGATCTTAAYQVRLAAGDYWECPAGQLSLIHSAVFATAGTARVTEVN